MCQSIWVDRLLRDLRETKELFGVVTTILAGFNLQGTIAIAFSRSLGTPGQRVAYASLIKADFRRDVRLRTSCVLARTLMRWTRLNWLGRPTLWNSYSKWVMELPAYTRTTRSPADEVVELGETGGVMPVKRPAPHLRLEEGIPVILGNLDTDTGLCNGYLSLACDLRRMRQLGFTMRRLQFPSRVVLAMTINKAQRKSLDCVGIDLPASRLRSWAVVCGIASSHECWPSPTCLSPLACYPVDDDDDQQAVDRLPQPP
ncbi:BQ5605_C035g11390 [Microbotryum silenes-dioicae]|uniref:BQ5605_C035g11390 protein n=1 Tax=Microbotryum silenes-dioicae TaxID=796604 RepID=A0A2X0N993_9BASI|nr:BQ5605_C035g11390 [Microbotryum silenes-dioicae]